jgi:putative endonuclease
MTTKDVGDAGEAQALAHLLGQGLALVERNYRVARGPHGHGGEVDIIMRERDGTLVFVEVRTRRGATFAGGSSSRTAFGGAAASVGATKQRRLVLAAQHFLRRFKTVPACRFDVVAIEGRGADARIEWFRAAFDTS